MNNNKLQITVETWDESKFTNSRDEWNELLIRSRSDQLFMSWEWMHSWWEVFLANKSYKLNLVVAKNADGRLIGIAPLFLNRSSIFKVLSKQELQLIGNIWNGAHTMRTELLDFICDKSLAEETITALLTYIYKSNNWDEFNLANLDKRSKTYQILVSHKIFKKCLFRQADEYESYFLETTSSFENYLSALGKNSRLKLFNRRKILETLGNVKYHPSNFKSIEESFDILNNFHKQRWGKPVFDGCNLSFNIKIAKLFAEQGSVNFSYLTIDDAPISIQYNYTVNNHTYNIQTGYKENLHKKLAPGFLHFGFEIENSFANKVSTYDFLAGEGKNTSYKESLTKTSLTMTDLQIIRNPILKIAYKIYDLRKNLFHK